MAGDVIIGGARVNAANPLYVGGTVSAGGTILPTPATASTTASVAGTVTAQTLLATNANRKGATIYNDSSALLYVKLGGTATTSDFTALLGGNAGGIGGYYEVPFHYTGLITGLWGSNAGSARVTELT